MTDDDNPTLDIGEVAGATVTGHAHRDDAALLTITGEDGQVTMTVTEDMALPLVHSVDDARQEAADDDDETQRFIKD